MSTQTNANDVTDEQITEYFAASDYPALTAPDIAETFDISQQAAHRRLTKLHERGVLDRRKVGGRAVIWWLADQESDAK